MKFLILIPTLFITTLLIGQAPQEQQRIIKAQYLSLSISQHQVPEQEELKQSDGFIMSQALGHGYKNYYTLFYDTKTSRSYYAFDTLIVDVEEEYEKVINMVPDKLGWVLKDENNKYYMDEVIFERQLLSIGEVKNLVWTITSETKEINGLKCQKAISSNPDLLLTAWYTMDIPVSTGPVNHFNLPGFVVWVEDFFRTTELQKVEYISLEEFDKMYNEKFNSFENLDFRDFKLVEKQKTKLVFSLKSMARSGN